jgi:hypothetical protein
MLSLRRALRSNRGQALVELALFLPLLIVLCLGAIEFANMINAHLVLTHLTREGANLVARESGVKGSAAWVANINNDLNLVVKSACPVITFVVDLPSCPATNTAQWIVIYSEVVWDQTPGDCPGAYLPITGVPGGSPDNYRIKRSGWGVTWTNGGLSRSSKIGADGACASASSDTQWNASIKGLTAIQLRFHVMEVFYDYAPSKLTPAQNFIGAFVPGIFYSKTVFMDVTGE